MKTPYYAVIFSSTVTDNELGYEAMSDKLLETVKQQEGYLGYESYRNKDKGVTISYWDSLEAIKKWKSVNIHQKAQNAGKEIWYKKYTVRICKVEKEYSFEK